MTTKSTRTTVITVANGILRVDDADTDEMVYLIDVNDIVSLKRLGTENVYLRLKNTHPGATDNWNFVTAGDADAFCNAVEDAWKARASRDAWEARCRVDTLRK